MPRTARGPYPGSPISVSAPKIPFVSKYPYDVLFVFLGPFGSSLSGCPLYTGMTCGAKTTYPFSGAGLSLSSVLRLLKSVFVSSGWETIGVSATSGSPPKYPSLSVYVVRAVSFLVLHTVSFGPL